MSTHEKLLIRFLSIPVDFKYTELKTLLSGFGYVETNKGKSSGSRVAFINTDTGGIIRLHKPHPKPVLKRYQVKEIIAHLEERGVI
ncbi:MAG TPA: hexulose-6-phosphate isomerase [Candidatus Margulisbacteria bacterium]|nr:hexulose-6-phosphate isomerase [Candidatus Margulisiibacteriota bacterium]